MAEFPFHCLLSHTFELDQELFKTVVDFEPIQFFFLVILNARNPLF